jgi:hypothetical protein
VFIDAVAMTAEKEDTMSRTLLLVLLFAAGATQAQPGPAGAPRPPGQPGPLSPEALASVPDLSAAQQVEVRKILVQRRDAHDAVRAKEAAEREAQRTRARSEHERIDDESSARLRKLLGEDAYRNLAQWLMPARVGGGPGRARSDAPHPPRGPEPVPGMSPLGDTDPIHDPLTPDAEEAPNEPAPVR